MRIKVVINLVSTPFCLKGSSMADCAVNKMRSIHPSKAVDLFHLRSSSLFFLASSSHLSFLTSLIMCHHYLCMLHVKYCKFSSLLCILQLTSVHCSNAAMYLRLVEWRVRTSVYWKMERQIVYSRGYGSWK